MLSPPNVAITPEAGTAIDANGTPAAAAYPIILPLKCPAAVIMKISENSSLPAKMTAGFTAEDSVEATLDVPDKLAFAIVDIRLSFELAKHSAFTPRHSAKVA